MKGSRAYWKPVLGLAVILVSGGVAAPHSINVARAADDTPIAATSALAAGCNETDLSDGHDTARNDPIWTPVLQDSSHPVPNDPPTILEGTVATPDQKFGVGAETPSSQAPSEIAEEDLPWNHFTHDKTIDVIPDPGYKHLLSSWVNADGSTGLHDDMEVEWENASLMDNNRTWGAEPEYVWPSVRDRVWIDGRWVFDCGHPGGTTPATVQYGTEIHPPRGVVTFRLNHSVAGDSSLPVTGTQSAVPVTEADAFFSGNGGLANDACSLTIRHINAVAGVLSGGLLGLDDCTHTGPVIPINDRNYVFDIYPPGTNFDPSVKLANGTYPVTAPTRDGSGTDMSLQWRTIDQSSQLPAHACGTDLSMCQQVTPLFCPVDGSTPAPDQTETTCPVAPVHPTRLRVILPFEGSSANVFSQSILLGWDNVPLPSQGAVRTFQVSLHKLTVVHNGESFLHDGDWRVFADVGGQWRYLSPLFDRNTSGDNTCHGDALTENGDGDCFQFDQHPWTVQVQDGAPIHVAVGGWESDRVDSAFCQTFSGCDPSAGAAFDLLAFNDDRIGTSEFDMVAPNYSAPAPYTTARLDDGEQYSAEFTVQEIAPPTPPTSGAPVLGSPSFTNGAGVTFVTSSSPISLSTSSPNVVHFQYRSRPDGGPLPTFASTLPFPVHWTTTPSQAGPDTASVFLTGVDGPQVLQYSAQTDSGLTEPRHTARLTLDNTPPVIGITQPTATQYSHSAMLTLAYTVTDGAGSGLQSVSPALDGATSLAGHGLLSGQAISLLTELSLGPHTFTVDSVDNLGNHSSSLVSFTVIVTAASIEDDVRQFQAAGKIDHGNATSLLAKLIAAASARARGDCSTAASIYQAFLDELRAQSGKHVDSGAATVLAADAQYLIAHCP